jgi:hypothetical protein
MADQLTPEEKLLDVIKNGAPAPGMIGASAPDGDVLGDGDTDDSIHEVSAGSDHFTGAGLIMRGLIGVAVLLAVAIGYEFHGAMPEEALPARVLESPDEGEAVQLFPPYAKVRASIVGGGIFEQPEPGKKVGPASKEPLWATYIRRNYNWLGVSRVTDARSGDQILEAIVMDRKVGKLQLLREGNRVFVSGPELEGRTQEVALHTVGREELLFSAGGFELRLKKQ